MQTFYATCFLAIFILTRNFPRHKRKVDEPRASAWGKRNQPCVRSPVGTALALHSAKKLEMERMIRVLPQDLLAKNELPRRKQRGILKNSI
jgi:hypothetical protein